MPNSKFIRAFNKPGQATYSGSFYNIVNSVYPAIFTDYTVVPAGFHDWWYKIKFRFNIDTSVYFNTTTTAPFFQLTADVGQTFIKLELGKDAISSNFTINEFININAGGHFYHTFGSSSVWPTSGTEFNNTTGTNVGVPFYFIGSDVTSFFNRINELFVYNSYAGGILTSSVYFGPSSGSGPMTLIKTLISSESLLSTTYSDHTTFQAFVNVDEPLSTLATNAKLDLFSSASLDVFQIEYGTGSFPIGMNTVDAPLIVSGGNGGYGSDFTEFNNTVDFINKVRPRTFPYTGQYNVFYEGYNQGWYMPLFNSLGPENGNTPANLPFLDAYITSSQGYFFDYNILAASLATAYPSNPSYYLPFDSTLESTYFEIYPTSSRGDVGRMMGPLGTFASTPTSSAANVLVTLSTVYLKYSTVRAPSVRRGLYLQRSSGSPHLSLEPVWPTSSWHLPGDVWFSDTTGSWRGFFYADYTSSTNIVTGSISNIVPYKVFATTGARDYIDGGSW